MDQNAFEEPVNVIVGLGFLRQVPGVMEAYTILCEWPPATADKTHAAALAACRRALAGAADADTVRTAFIAFATRNHLLAPDTEQLVAAHAAGALDDRRPGV